MNSTNKTGSSAAKPFGDGLLYGSGVAAAGAIAKHIGKYHKSSDPCGAQRLCAMVALAYFDVKKCLFGAGPAHQAAVQKLKGKIERIDRG